MATFTDFGWRFRFSGALPLIRLACLLSVCASGLVQWGSARAEGDPDYAAGVAAYRAGRYVAADEALRQVLAREPRNVNAHYYRALALDNLGYPGGAASEYRYVADYGQEERIVAYARERTERLRADLPRPAGRASNADVTPDDAKPDYPKKVPLTHSRNALMLDAVLQHGHRQAQASFIVDTGATYTSISQDLAEQLGLDVRQGERIRITTANGRIDVPKVVIAALSVNGLEARNVEATVIPMRQGASFSGLLGLSFLRQFVVTIDPRAGHLIFNRQAD
jgi:clan AA aspartic protease (TIGR02281 family)